MTEPLALVRPGLALVNVARGRLVDEAALADALLELLEAAGRIPAAA